MSNFMRSIPYKIVIPSYTIFNKTQILSIRPIRPKIETINDEYKISNKGAIKIEFINCTDKATTGFCKYIMDSKLEAYLPDTTISEILTKNETSLEYKTYQDTVKFEVKNNGSEWKIFRGNESRSIVVNDMHKFMIYKLFNVRCI